MSKKDQESSSKIIQYLTQQNRPYSVNDIFLNLHKEIGKTAVQKFLDQLVEAGKIKEKTYGKQKVYVIDQSQFPPLDEEKLREMDASINELGETIKEKYKLISQLESRLKILEGSLTNEQTSDKLNGINDEVSKMEDKLSNLRNNCVVISKQERERVYFERDTMVKAWRKRRRLTLNMVDAILEGYPKSKKDLFEEVGIETDEDAGTLLPST